MSAGTGKTFAMLPWWPGSFMSSTRGWSLTAKGLYRELLDAQWDMGTLPADLDDLQRIIGATPQEWAAGWARCASKFVAVNGGLQNPRLEEHRVEAKRRRDAKARGAASTNAKLYGERGAERGGSDTLSDPLSDPISGSPISPTSSSSLSPESGVSFGNSHARVPAKHVTVPAFHQEVIDAYHQILPDSPRVRAWTGKRRGTLDARIAERVSDGRQANTIQYWSAFFEAVAASDYLTGKVNGFRPGLEWLLRPESFLKVIEGTYTNRAPHTEERRHAG